MTVALLSQPSLFGREDAVVPDVGPRLRRIGLAHDAWVDHCVGWLTGHQALFDELVGAVQWSQHRRPMYDRYVDVPRLMGEVPVGGASPTVIAAIQHRLGQRYDVEFDRVGLALYRNGADSVAWHGDQVARELPEALVATVSLGEPRTFALRPKGGGIRRDMRLGHGDLVVMGGTCQRTWEHAVPKVRRAGPRIALMFRPATTSSRPGVR